jgi:hypothetical protein
MIGLQRRIAAFAALVEELKELDRLQQQVHRAELAATSTRRNAGPPALFTRATEPSFTAATEPSNLSRKIKSSSKMSSSAASGLRAGGQQ